MSSIWSWLKRQEKWVREVGSFRMDSSEMKEIVETAESTEKFPENL